MASIFDTKRVAGMPIPGLAPGTSMVIQAIPQVFNVRLRLQQKTYLRGKFAALPPLPCARLVHCFE